MKKWYEIKNYADKAEILIYDQIGSGFWSSGIEAKDLVKEIGDIKASQIDIRINSPGGSVFDGIAIYNAIKRHPAKKTTYNDGLAASIASVIFLAGDKKVSAENAMTMIHNPFGVVMGDAAEMRKMADVLDKLKESIVMAYQKSTMLTDKELQAAMDAETWYTATEAKEIGFVDEITGESDSSVVANFNFQKLGYNKIPINFMGFLKPNKQETLFGGVKNMAPSVDEKQLEDERKRCSDITLLANQYGCSEKLQGWINGGVSADVVAREILASKTSKPIPQPASDGGLAGKVVEEEYSLCRAIEGMASERSGGRFEGYERDISDRIKKNLPANYVSQGGYFVPLNLCMSPRAIRGIKNTLDTKSPGYGVETIFEQQGSMIEMYSNMSVLGRKGVTILTGLTGPVVFAKQIQGLTVYWIGENPTSGVTASDVKFGTITMSPKTMMGKSAYSRQFLAMSTIDAEGMLRRELSLRSALGMDFAGLHGTGTNNEPKGIYNITGVNTVAMGGVPTYGKFIDMQTPSLESNVPNVNPGYLTTIRMAGKMKQTLEASSAGSTWIWQGKQLDGTVAGYQAMASNQISKTLSGLTHGAGAEHGIIFGADWSDAIMGFWGVAEIVVDPYTLADKGLISVVSFQMCDFALRHQESFTVSTGATIS